ncbi:unnamed protein product [Cladocopium goreaui]|uniref:Pentacotripeptide-repeat region of PRORP domain-containing protein n=1 Tax=Cladocopium goreaui TaxID=2562237 RepID=A0A9P1BT44_9DINO|nr:unnamed protein product [Cladocopium goreaui]
MPLARNAMATQLITSHAKRQDWPGALEILVGLQHARSANVISFGAAIHACDRARWTSAVLLQDVLRSRSLESNVVTSSAAISSCQKLAAWESALELFRLMSSAGLSADVVVWGAGISAAGGWQRSHCLLCEMEHQAVETNHITTGAALSHCPPWHHALQCGVRDTFAQGLRPDVVTFNVTMSACEKVTSWLDAVVLLQEVSKQEMRQSVITFNTTVSAGEKAGRWQEVLLLFQSAVAKTLQPDAFTTSPLLNACAKTVHWQHALQLAGAAGGHCSDLVILNGLINACGKSSHWPLALAILENVLMQRLEPDIITYSAAISACEERNELGPARCGFEDAWERALLLLFQASESQVEVNVFACSATISACSKTSNWQQAVMLLEMVCNLQVQLNLVAYNATFTAFQESNCWRSAIHLSDAAADAASLDLVGLSAICCACGKVVPRQIWLRPAWDA